MKEINSKLAIERQFNNCRPTCVAVTDDLVLIGTSNGELYMFDRGNQEPYAVFMDKSKEF